MRARLAIGAAAIGLATTAFATAGQPDAAPPTLVIDVTVNTVGRVSECRIVTSSGVSQRDEKTCQIALMRFRFPPKIVDGQPIGYNKTLPIRWAADGVPVQ